MGPRIALLTAVLVTGGIVALMNGAAATPDPRNVQQNSRELEPPNPGQIERQNPRELQPQEQSVVAEHAIDEVELRASAGKAVVALGPHRETGEPWAVVISGGFPRSAGPVSSELGAGEAGDGHLALFGHLAQARGSAVVSATGEEPRQAQTTDNLWAVIVPDGWLRQGIKVRFYDPNGGLVESAEIPPR